MNNSWWIKVQRVTSIIHVCLILSTINIIIHVNGCIGMGTSALLFPGVYNDVKTALGGLPLTCFRSISVWYLRFLQNTIIVKTKVNIYQAQPHATLANFDCPVKAL
jgi:hypothetical protein